MLKVLCILIVNIPISPYLPFLIDAPFGSIMSTICKWMVEEDMNLDKLNKTQRNLDRKNFEVLSIIYYDNQEHSKNNERALNIKKAHV